MKANRFDTAAQTWDVNPITQNLSQAINVELDSQIVFSDKMQVLDYGAGTGLMLFHIQPKVKHLTAIDTSEGMRDIINQKISAKGISNISVMNRDISKELLPENTYDVIVSSMTLHHIKDTQDFFDKMFVAALEEGGKVAIVDLVTEDGSFHREPDESIHHLGFDPNEIARIMREAGFIDVSVKPFYSILKEGKEYPVFMAIGTKD